MVVTQTDNSPGMGKWIVILGAIFVAGLIVASIWSVVRALSNPAAEPENDPALQNSAIPAGGPATMDAGRIQEEFEKQYVTEQRIEPVTRVPVAAPPAVIPTNRNNDEVKLQKTKAKVNQRLVERLKKYAKDHPGQDNRELEKEIKKREQLITPTP